MKSLRPLFLSLMAIALAAPLAAQMAPATPAPAAAPAPKVIAPTSLAFVNSSAFLDETAGIKQLVRAAQGLELEFSTTQSELSLLNEKLRTIVGELNKLNADAATNAKAISEKQAAGVALQQDLQAKQQAAQQAYAKRSQEVQGPIAVEIGKELRAFAKERDLGMVLDLAKLGEAVLDAKPELDLTAEFVVYYNAKHP
ncbi:MAG: OmpH family outer membrane protein [Lacunisphaera sp.]|nr:OmpH family outer membrane protein [Lacunisphaera sp.]